MLVCVTTAVCSILGDQTFKLDLRNQIVGEVMTPYTLQKYGLNDEAAMRRIIEEADVIVGNDENVAVLATPYGPQPTAMCHWTAHRPGADHDRSPQ